MLRQAQHDSFVYEILNIYRNEREVSLRFQASWPETALQVRLEATGFESVKAGIYFSSMVVEKNDEGLLKPILTCLCVARRQDGYYKL